MTPDIVEILIPDLGVGVEEGVLAEWMVQTGDDVRRDEVIATIETDKVTMTLDAPVAGTISEIRVPDGAPVTKGAVAATIMPT